jgi:hypothetical protein
MLVLTLSPALGCAAAGEVSPTKVGPELRSLYEEYLAARESGRPFVVADPSINIVEERVIIDAVATNSVEGLKADLVALGMRNAVAAGRIVSGQLPIREIPKMASLSTLRFARAARSMTN